MNATAVIIEAACPWCGAVTHLQVAADYPGDADRLARATLCGACSARRERLTTRPDPDEPERLRPTREPELQSWADRSQPKED